MGTEGGSFVGGRGKIDFDRAGRVARGLLAPAITAAVAGATWFIFGRIPLAPLDPRQYLSGYGIEDNRHLLLRYGGLILAAFLGPLIALGIERLRGLRPASPPSVLDLPRQERPTCSRPVAWLLPVVLLILLVGPGVAHRPLNGHELVHLGYLSEIDHGRILNLDTRVTYGPLLGYSLWGFMKVVGFDLVGFRLYWNVAAAVGLAALALLASHVLRSRFLWGLLILYLLLHTVARLFLPDAGGVNGGLWGWGNLLRHGWAALVILGFAGPLARSSAAWIRLLAGAAVAMGVAYAQETASGALVSLGLLLFAARPRIRVRGVLHDVAWVAAGGAAVLGLLAVPAILRGALGEYISATLEIPRLFLQGGGNAPYPPLLGEDRHGHAAWAGYYLLPAGCIVALAWLWGSALRGRRHAIALPLAGYAAVSFVTVIVRADGLHLLNVAVAPILLGFVLVDLGLHGRPALRWSPALLLVPLLLARPGLPAIGSGLLGRVLHPAPDPPAGWEPIPGGRGGVWTPAGDWFDSADWGGQDDPEAPDFISEAAEDAPVYIRGNKASLYYFLAHVPAAASYTDLSSQCLTPQAYERLFRELAIRPPRLVFLMEDSIGPRPRPKDGYRALGTYHGLELFQRRDLPPPDPDSQPVSLLVT